MPGQLKEVRNRIVSVKNATNYKGHEISGRLKTQESPRPYH